MKLVNLDKNENIKPKEKIALFLNPDYIYIPIENHKIPYKKNTKVKKGEQIFNIYCSISGKIIGIKECSLWNKKQERCLVIANDFEETLKQDISTRKKITTLKKEDMIQEIKDLDQKKFSQSHIKHILVSGIDNEPYIENERFIQKENTKTILELIDGLLKIYGATDAFLAIKNTDDELIEIYQNLLGSYKEIKMSLVEDLYLIGEERFLSSKLDIKEEYLYLKTSELFLLYHNIKKRKPIFEKYITISGNGIKNPQIILTKIGVKISDIIKKFYNISLDDYDIYANGLMSGKKVLWSNLIVTKDLEGILIMKKEKKKAKNCIKCGKCIEVCPIHSNPLLAYKNKIKVPCINCGLCSYICPAYINLRKYLIGDTDE